VGTPEALAASISAIPGAKGALRKDMLIGLEEGLRGRRGIKPPEAWNQAFDASMADPDLETRERALSLATQFGDVRALVKLRARLSDVKEPSPARLRALEAIVAARDTSSLPNVIALTGPETTDMSLRAAAVRALAAYDSNDVPDILLKAWKTMPAALRRDAVATLASRSAWGLKLMDAVAAGTVATADIPAETVRQLGDLRDPKLLEAIAKSWGQIRATPADRKARIAKTKALVNKAGAFDLAQGRAIYQKVCAQCHTMYGTGAKVGPELTGSNRANLDYLLENIHDPSAVITKEYTVSLIELKSGRVVSGIVKAETPQALTVATANEVLTIPAQDIETRKASDQSMMPDNLVDSLKPEEIRDLVAYMRHPSQTPIAATPQTLPLFFNSKDLSGWTGDSGMWRVENGEMVGVSKGLKRNNFLASELKMNDFRIEFEVMLSPDSENSGVQIRSALLPDGEMAGPQADIGKGWWGKLYEEHGRGLLWPKSGEAHVKPGAWNRYVIEAKGPRIRTWINDQPCVDLTDDKISRSGQIGLQLHSGGPLEVRYRGFKLELLGP
jgi:putative heme-binding domain-containing protein